MTGCVPDRDEPSRMLDQIYSRLLAEDFDGVTFAAHYLANLRSSVSAEAWKILIGETIRRHRVIPLLHEDPMTNRSFCRPRGYAGDAGLLDLIYRHPDAALSIDRSSSRGRKIYEKTVSCSGPQSVRDRRHILANELDRAARDYDGCAALSIACGHLREGELSEGVRSKSFSRLLGLDQDQESLDVANGALAQFGFEAVNRTVKTLVAGRSQWLREFDFVYAAGLYDYLSDRFARRLTARLFELLKPGGRLLIANFLPGVPDAGYLEAAMDWWLVYRTPEEICDFPRDCPPDQIESIRLFDEPGKHIGFLEIVRG